MRTHTTLLTLALLLAGAGAAQAAPITDPVGDFLAPYTGPKNGDMDVVLIQGVYNGVTIRLDGTLNGAPGTTAGSSYIWGLQRGQGTARFGAAAPGVLFDSIVSVAPNGTASVRDLISGVTTVLPTSSVTVTGNKISVTFNASLLPNLGLTTPRYLFNLWPRTGAGISDFSPDNSDAALTLAFPTPDSAAAQTNLAIDDSSLAFDRLTEALRDRRGQSGAARPGVFMTVYGQSGSKGLSNSFVGRHDGWALMGGADRQFGPGFTFGLAGRGGRTTATLTDGSHLTMDTLGGTAYVDFSQGPWFADVFADVAQQQFRSTRNFLIGTNAVAAAATPKGDTLSGGGQVGYTFKSGGFAVIPSADLIVTRSKVGAYAEAEPTGFGSSVDARSRQSTRLGLGVAIEQTDMPAWGSLYLHASARYIEELGDRSDDFSYAFNAQPENHFAIASVTTGRDYWALGVGADANVGGRAKVSVDYAPRFDGKGVMDHQFSVSARLTF